MHNGRLGVGTTSSRVPDSVNPANAGLYSSSDVWRQVGQSDLVVVAGAKILSLIRAPLSPNRCTVYRDRSAAGTYSSNQFIESGNTAGELNGRSQRPVRIRQW